MDRAEVLERVDAHFVTTGAHTPPWPDPHPNRAVPPRDDEYSRCPDPAKYRILLARLEAWSQALDGLGLATARDEPELGPRFQRDLQRPAGRTLRIAPARPGGLPLLANLETVLGATEAAVTLATDVPGAPLVLLRALPDCGCDACDYGSADLLEDFDTWLLAVVTGEFVQVETAHGPIRSPGATGWEASGDFPREFDIEGALRAARAGAGGHPAVRGAGWW